VLPPQVTAVYPPARALGVPYDASPLWAAFVEPLDPTTVNEHTVFLKIDDARSPCAVRWNDALRRIEIAPDAPLRLRTIYTVELTPSIRTAGGGVFDRTYFWQFGTSSLRAPTNPQPGDGASGESPVVTLFWEGNTGLPDGVRYTIYAGADSTQVATRAVSPLGDILQVQRWLPRAHWPGAARVWWAVTANNLATGERLDGPTWRFDVVDPSTVTLDTLRIIPVESGWQLSRFVGSCTGAQLTCGAGYSCLVRWAPEVLGSTARVVSARIDFDLISSTNANAANDVYLVPVVSPWPQCGSWFQTPPQTDDLIGRLSFGRLLGAHVMRFDDDALAAHIEDMIRHTDYHGYLLRATSAYWTFAGGNTTGPELPPLLTLLYYRSGTAPSAVRAGR
jgi:Big-like domain-containing protein